MTTEPATWRDLLWLLLEVPVGVVLGLVPAALIFYGLNGVLLEPVFVGAVFGPFGYGATWPVDHPLDALLVLPQGLLILTAGAGSSSTRSADGRRRQGHGSGGRRSAPRSARR